MPERIDTYEAAVQFLYDRINYERVDAQSYSTSDFKLDRMRILLALIGNPQDRIPAVHVAGTKGKGSTCSMIAGVLAASSLRTGLYISPHISAFEERMTVNGVRPTRPELVGLVNRLLPVVAQMDCLPGQMQPTYFELATAMAWLHFEDQRCDLAVLETGLGGRLDSTNICRPLVCVITNISRDHTHILGSTISQITWEKAGIIKQSVPVISGVRQPEAVELIEGICRERQAPLILLDRNIIMSDRRSHAESTGDGGQYGANAGPGLQIRENIGGRQDGPIQQTATTPYMPPERAPVGWVDVRTPRSEWKRVPVALRGAHQAVNTALALAAIDELRIQGRRITDSHVYTGLANVTWPARVEVVARSPVVVVDAAHNWESARALIATLREEFQPRRRILIFAATRDKDVTGLLRLLLLEFDTVILTRYLDNPRSVPLQGMLSFIQAISNRQVHLADTPQLAWNLARQWADPRDLIAVTGSFFLVAELRDLIISDRTST